MGKHLFFIDDDTDFIYLLKRTCRKIDDVSKVSSAYHGQDALDKVSQWLEKGEELPDIAFIDINMPVMDGFEFLEHFKEKRKEEKSLEKIIPVVMLTSSSNVLDREKAYSTGVVSEYFIKPANVMEMENIIKKVISANV